MNLYDALAASPCHVAYVNVNDHRLFVRAFGDASYQLAIGGPTIRGVLMEGSLYNVNDWLALHTKVAGYHSVWKALI